MPAEAQEIICGSTWLESDSKGIDRAYGTPLYVRAVHVASSAPEQQSM